MSWGSPPQTPLPQQLGGFLALLVCRQEHSGLSLNGSDGLGPSLIFTKPLVSRDLRYLIWICSRVLPPPGLPSLPRAPQIARMRHSPSARAASMSTPAQTSVLFGKLVCLAAARRDGPRTGAQSTGSSTRELQRPLGT